MRFTSLNRILLHIFFWLSLIVYSTFFFGYPDRFWVMFLLTLAILPIDMAFVYFTMYVLIPKALLKRKFVLFALVFLFLGYVDEIILRSIDALIIHSREYELKDIFWGRGVWDLFSNYYFALLASAIRLFRIWYLKSKENLRISSEKYQTELRLKDAELKLLKAQIHPHFLFNTLNNLYGLTLEASDKAPEIVLKLSALLDYVMYRCNANVVSLSNEISQIKNYIDIEKIRYDESLSIKVKHEGDTTNLNIAPLLLLPFVENSFKHGASKSSSTPWIEILFKIINDVLYFQITNSKVDEDEKSEEQGIGLQNVRKRLELYYKNNYSLDIVETKSLYSVTLIVDLSKNPSNQDLI